MTGLLAALVGCLFLALIVIGLTYARHLDKHCDYCNGPKK